MPSKRRSNTSRRKQKQRSYRFFLDRNLGAYSLKEQLGKAGVRDVVVHDDLFERTERDPWIFYKCGKDGLIVISSDKTFMKLFPHMAAIALGRTTVLYFTHNNYKSRVRGDAFLKAYQLILRTLQRAKKPFIGCISMDGSFRIVETSPAPTRKQCELQDWDSYRRVCKSEGVRPTEPEQLRAISPTC